MRADVSRAIACSMTILLAAIPASILSAYTILGLAVAVQAMISGDPEGGLLFVWCLAGLIGTVSLWFVAFRARHRYVALGLVFGLFAIAPLSIMLLHDLLQAFRNQPLVAFWALSLPLTAVYWLFNNDWNWKDTEQPD